MNNMMKKYKRTKFACYSAYFTMSSVFSLPPLLFVTLRSMYNISYTLLGTLVLTNFCTQMIIDLIFTVFSKHFNVKKVVRVMPVITSAGFVIYALVPHFFPQYAYIGLLIGTITFSVSAGLSEVLLSPIIAAIPSDNPQKDMSLLHSLYAFGVFSVVALSTVFFKIFGNENWLYLSLFFAFLPLISAVLFMLSPIPDMSESDSSASSGSNRKKIIGLAMCVGCIFFGSCAENTMSNWISGYMENALHIEKAVGDILGMAVFAILLGIARISYASFGKNIGRVLLTGMIGSAVCYIVAGLSTGVYAAFAACIFTGLFTSMLWPGTLIMMEEKIPGVGVSAYALMAAGGDMGASVAPQLMGIITDKVSASAFAAEMSKALNLSAEQVGLKTGMVITSAFPIIGAILVICIIRYFSKGIQQI